MKRNNFYNIWGIALLAIALTSSCKKYLEEKPTTQFTADFVYNTPEGLEAGVNALYSFQREFWENGANNGSNPIVIDAKDDLTINRNAEVANYGRMFCGTTPDNDCGGVYSNYWRTYYRIIDRANALVKAADAISMDESTKKRLVGEAKFFRANSIFILYRLFNNIYVTTEPTTPENALTIIQDKTPVADIYKQINEDLTYSIENLPWTTNEFGRITQAAARHVKADVALWQQNWQEAKTQAEAVISQTGIHSLVAQTGLVFRGDLKNTENLWVLQWKRNENGKAHKINFNLMPNYAELTPGSKYSIEQGGRGFGWLTLNNYLRDLLAADPNDTRIKGAYYIKDYVFNDAATLPPGQVLGAVLNFASTTPWKEFDGSAANRNGFFIRMNAGCKKYFPDDGIPTEDNQTKNIAVFRLAETMLFAAEANLMLGNIGTSTDNAMAGTALGQLNTVRVRAGTTPATAITIDSILNEQARELAFEGKRLYMLKRLGLLYNYIVDHAGYGMPGDLSPENSTAGGANNTPEKPLPYRTDARRTMQPHMINWPIPRAEMNLLGPSYPQNAGY
ncbi:RagB/SusD family nutrient uptake outer membrane protein [Terrimonas sp.]|uniref:RagB/SusD family nutrient uptake outer membrane protein n=1 Tax=Terrimonas sp. TaxID=1914338 RepID=UPI000D50F2EC|nr:RagB/SusD family nutrient uptake outer membrane protein [Terrimonas sp.]PVD50402.1 RagB/SusD family nutrient uptake outer membrane protein [Terrimonas sp.]